MATANNHITVCICTYKRVSMLQQLLDRLQDQTTHNLFSYSVIVVDNDADKSAELAVSKVKSSSKIVIDYYSEPVQNIALARNKAVTNANGNYLAFLDDDEFPHAEWLVNLFKTCQEYQADGVLGPVKPHFDVNPPDWIVRGKICERKSFDTGTILTNPSDTRTGNVLFKKSLFDVEKYCFNPDYGRTGGEDIDFFRRTISDGKKYVWCNEAPVFEHVPEERLTKSYHLRRALLRGKVAASRKGPVFTKVMDLMKSSIAIFIYSIGLPILIIFAPQYFMRYFIKLCDHAGKILYSFKIEIVKER